MPLLPVVIRIFKHCDGSLLVYIQALENIRQLI